MVSLRKFKFKQASQLSRGSGKIRATSKTKSLSGNLICEHNSGSESDESGMLNVEC
jgi:hypothetical protein